MAQKTFKGHYRSRESSGLITLPAKLIQQKDFPLKDGWKVNITMDNNKLIITQSDRFEHINTYVDHASIYDNAIGREVDVYLQPDTLVCDFCHSTRCDHTKYAVDLEEVKESYIRKGLRLPEVK